MKKLIIILFMMIFISNVYAEEITEIRLITDEWSGYTHENGSGLYFDILKEIYEPKGIKLNIKLVPWALAKEYAPELADALVGASMFDQIKGMRPSPMATGC